MDGQTYNGYQCIADNKHRSRCMTFRCHGNGTLKKLLTDSLLLLEAQQQQRIIAKASSFP